MIDYIKKNFQKPENGLMQIIMINSLVFAACVLVKIIRFFTGISYEPLWQYIYLSIEWGDFQHRFWTILTYAFVHDRFLSLLSNMFLLHTFGSVIVYFLGSKHLIRLYVLGGLVGGVSLLLCYNLLPALKSPRVLQLLAQSYPDKMVMGVSASVYAVMAGAATFAPNFIFHFFLIPQIKLKYIVFFLLALSVIYLVEEDTIQRTLELGGAFGGFIYVYGLQQETNLVTALLRPLWHILKKPLSFFHRKKNKEIKAKPTKVSQKDIDIILDKIAASGYKSLTEEEKKILFRAGK